MKDGGKERLLGFEGLRGLLACWVVFCHIFQVCAISEGAFPPLLRSPVILVRNGGAAVECFMILSGFVIFLLLDKKMESYGPYITRRFLRLYPVFALCTLAGFLLQSHFTSVLEHVSWSGNLFHHMQVMEMRAVLEKPAAHLALHSMMLHGIVPMGILPFATGAFLSPAWSVSLEWQFYLIAPLLFWAAGNTRRWPLLLGLTLLCYGMAQSGILNGFVNVSPAFLPLNLQLFVLGGLCERLYKACPSRVITRSLACGLVLAVFTFSFLFISSPALQIWVTAFTLILANHLGDGGGWPKQLERILASKPLLFLGRISYSIYLSHWIATLGVLSIIYHFHPGCRPGQTWFMMMAAVPLVTLAFSFLLNVFVEQPAIVFGRKLTAHNGPVPDSEQINSLKSRL